jgi:uncharacterized membrane protein YeaQ/YmgE (transglycosylase-associated protein family)
LYGSLLDLADVELDTVVANRIGALSEDNSMIVNLLSWAVFGLLAGIVAKFVGDRSGRAGPAGILYTIVLGIAGALLGGFLSTRILGWDLDTFSLAGFAVAVGGAVILLFLYSLFQSARKTY